MKTEIRIIKEFINSKKPMTIREIAKAIKSDYRITYIAAQRLVSKGIIAAKTVGKSSLCSLNDHYYGIEIYKSENERKESILKNKDIKQLYREIMNKLDSSLFILLLFGSYAKGKQTKSSDIDLMFISNDTKIVEKVNSIISILPLRLHANTLTEEEFIRMKDAKKLNVVKEIIENNIILYGIESFYKLKNA